MVSKKLIIACGGRKYSGYNVVEFALREERPTFVIEGGAQGADALVRRACDNLVIPHITAWALWKQPQSKKAGYDRNLLMMKILLKLADENETGVVAFPGGVGTQMMIDIAEQHGVPVRRYE